MSALAHKTVKIQADQGSRHHAEITERAIAPADIGRIDEDVADAGFARDPLQARSGIGDDDELIALAAGLLPEIVVERQGLDGAARFTGDDKECVCQRDRVFDLSDASGIGAIEYDQGRETVLRTKSIRQHFRRQRTAAHAQQNHMLEAAATHTILQSLQPPAVDSPVNIQPAQPIDDLFDGGSVSLPQTAVFVPETGIGEVGIELLYRPVDRAVVDAERQLGALDDAAAQQRALGRHLRNQSLE